MSLPDTLQKFGEDWTDEWLRGLLKEKGMQYKNFSFCFYAIDARFKHELRPVGSHDDSIHTLVQNTNCTVLNLKFLCCRTACVSCHYATGKGKF